MIRVLFVVIFILALWVPIFNRAGPALFGFPFFYWYQLAAILVSACLTGIVYIVENRKAENK